MINQGLRLLSSPRLQLEHQITESELREYEQILAELQLREEGREEEQRNQLQTPDQDEIAIAKFLGLHFCEYPVRFLLGPPRICKVDGIAPDLFDLKGRPLYYKGSKRSYLHMRPPAGMYPWNLPRMSKPTRWVVFLGRMDLEPNVDGYDSEGEPMEGGEVAEEEERDDGEL